MRLVCHHSSGSATPVEVIRESSSSSESTPSVVPVKEESRPAHTYQTPRTRIISSEPAE